jgi:acetyl esterase/lipase
MSEFSADSYSSFLARLGYYVQAYALRFIVPVLSRLGIFLRPIPASCAPTFVKRYAGIPGPASRVWIPSSYTSQASNPERSLSEVPKLPVLVSIHAGGFSSGQPSNIDRFCHYMANTSGLIIVSANRRKAPKSRFPIPPIDVANVVRVIMDDTSADLYLADRSKVAVCGFSSGANLAMAVSQLPILRNDDGSHMLRGALGIYGNYDLRTTFKSKITGSGQPQESFERSLESRLDAISFIYEPDPADKKNALASPFLVKRAELPKNVFLVGCQKDVLWPEANRMCERLSREGGEERVKTQEGWKQGGVRWGLLPKVGHVFDLRKAMGDLEIPQEQTFRTLCATVTEWLAED